MKKEKKEIAMIQIKPQEAMIVEMWERDLNIMSEIDDFSNEDAAPDQYEPNFDEDDGIDEETDGVVVEDD